MKVEAIQADQTITKVVVETNIFARALLLGFVLSVLHFCLHELFLFLYSNVIKSQLFRLPIPITNLHPWKQCDRFWAKKIHIIITPVSFATLPKRCAYVSLLCQQCVSKSCYHSFCWTRGWVFQAERRLPKEKDWFCFFSVLGFGNAMRTARFFSVREGKSKMRIMKRWQCSKTPASKHPAG